MIADIQPPLSDKNPQIKEGTLKFLHRCLLSTPAPPTPAQVKPLSEALATLLGDSASGVRDEAALSLGALMKIVGERALNPVVEPLEASRKTKVKEAFDQAVVKCKVGSAAPKPPPSAPKEAPPAKKKALVAVKKEARPTSPALENEPASPAPRAKPPARLMVCSCRNVILLWVTDYFKRLGSLQLLRLPRHHQPSRSLRLRHQQQAQRLRSRPLQHHLVLLIPSSTSIHPKMQKHWQQT